ncbi:MAG: linear amide C-N hydrolase [Hyphomicrobiaceae bacterium]
MARSQFLTHGTEGFPMKSLRKVIVFAMIAQLVAVPYANACSFFFFDTPQGNRIVGRSMEGPIEMQELLFIAARGYTGFGGVTGKYGYVGIRHGRTDWVSSGVNEHGLNVESLGLGAQGTQTKYLPAGQGDKNQQNLLAHILGNAKNVDEAIELVKQTKVETSKLKVAHDLEVGLHFSITDKYKAVVIEYTDGSGYPVVYENTLQVLTNEPVYPVQMALADDIIGGPTYDKAVTKFSPTRFRGFERSSTGRFQHLVSLIYTADYSRVNDDFDAVNRAWTMLNTIDIPQGVLYWLWLDSAPQMVGYFNVVDLKNKVYYVRTHDNMDIRKVDLSEIDFATVTYKEKSLFDQISEYKDVKFD